MRAFSRRLRSLFNLQDREEAEARLARLQVEHLDMTQRFLSLKTEVALVRFPFRSSLNCLSRPSRFHTG